MICQRLKKAVANRNRQNSFELEALEPRVLLSGEMLSAAALPPGGDSERGLMQDSVLVVENSVALAALEASICYTPEEQLDDIFGVDPTDEDSEQTVASGDQTQPVVGPIQEQTGDPATAVEESGLGAAAETVAAEASNGSLAGDPGSESTGPVLGTDSTVFNPQPEQLTETLRAANGPPVGDIAPQQFPTAALGPMLQPVESDVVSDSISLPASETAPVASTSSPSNTIHLQPDQPLDASTGLVVGPSVTLSGSGDVQGDVVVLGHLSPGNSPRIEYITGDLTLLPTTTTTIEIGGRSPGPGSPNVDDGYDQINVTGIATFGGTLEITLINDFSPAPGDTFQILTCGLAAGDFASIQGLYIPGGVFLIPIQSPTGLVLVASSLPSGFALLRAATESAADEIEAFFKPTGSNTVSFEGAINVAGSILNGTSVTLTRDGSSPGGVAITVTGLNFELKAGVKRMVGVSDGSFGFVFTPQGFVGAMRGATVSWPDFGSTFTLTGTVDLDLNTTATATAVGIDLDGDGNVTPQDLVPADTVKFTVTGTLELDDFVHLTGTFAFETAADESVTLSGQSSPITVSVLKVGADHVHAFLGVGGPYWVSDSVGNVRDPTAQELATGTMGVALADMSFGLALMKPVVDPGEDLPTQTYYALKGSGSAELIGIDTSLTLTGTLHLQIEVNGASDSALGPVEGIPVVDFTQLFGGKMIVATGPDPDGGGSAPAPTVELDFAGPVLRGAGSPTLTLAEFGNITGQFAFEKSGLWPDAKVKVGATNVTVTLGATDGVNVALTNGTLALVLFPGQQGSGGSSYALRASGAVKVNGITGLTASGIITLEVNTAGAFPQAESVTVSRPGDSSLFLQADLRDVSLLIARLQDDWNSGTKPLSDYLWGLIPPTTRDVLTNLELGLEARTSALTDALNLILEAGAIYTPQREEWFNDVVLSAETLQLLNQQPAPTGPALVHLNRLLLEDAYAPELARLRETIVLNYTEEEDLLRFSGVGITLSVNGVVDLTGDFVFTKDATKITVGARNVSARVGVGGVAVTMREATAGLVLFSDGTYAVAGSGTLGLTGIPTLTATGTIGVEVSTALTQVSVPIWVGPEAWPEGMGTEEVAAGARRLYGEGVNLSLSGFATVTGNFAVTKTGTGASEKILIGAAEATATLDAGTVSVSVTNITLGAALYGNGTYALYGAGAVTLSGFPDAGGGDPLLNVSGTVAVEVNTASRLPSSPDPVPVNETIPVPGGFPDVTLNYADNVRRLYGTGLSLNIADFVTLTGNFSLDKVDAGAGDEAKIKVGGTAISASLSAGNVSVSLTDGQLGLVLFGNGTYALKASGEASLNGFPDTSGADLLTASGTLLLEVNTHGAFSSPERVTVVCLEGRTSAVLLAGDFEVAAALIARLSTATDNPESPSYDLLSYELWNRIPAGTRQQLLASGSAQDLASALNVILNESSLYTKDTKGWFTGAAFSLGTLELLQRYRLGGDEETPPTGEDLVRLNRMLLEDAYPGAIARLLETIELNYRENVARFAGSNLSIAIKGFVTLTGNFAIEKATTGPERLLVGANQVSATLGVGNVSVTMSGARLGLVLFGDGKYAAEGYGTVALTGIPGLTLSGTIGVAVNTTGTRVTETILVGPNPTDTVPVNVEAGGRRFQSPDPIEFPEWKPLTVNIADYVKLIGRFKFDKGTDSTGAEVIEIVATEVTAFLGVGEPRIDDPASSDPADTIINHAGAMGVLIEHANLGLLLYNGSFALRAEAQATLVGFGEDILSLSGDIAVRVNTTGRAPFNESVPVRGPPEVTIQFDEGEGNFQSVTGEGVTLSVAGFDLTGNFGFTKEEDPITGATKIKVGASGVDAFLGTADETMGIRINDADLGLVLVKSGSGSPLLVVDENEAENDIALANVDALVDRLQDDLLYPAFSTADLLNLAAFASKLKNPAPADHVSSYLYGRLLTTTKDLLASYTSGPNPALLAALVADLNTIIEGASVYNETIFQGVALRQETRDLLDDNPQGPELARLNRMLLEDAYPQQLFKNTAYDLSQYLWGQFSGEIKDVLTDSGATDAAKRAKRTALVAGLNAILSNGSERLNHYVAEAALSQEIRLLLDRNPTGSEWVYVNRLILSNAYPQIARTLTGPARYALDASAGVELVGFDPAVLALSGTVGVRINKMLAPVDESVPVGSGSVRVKFDTAADFMGFSGTGVKLTVAGVDLKGNFVFTKQEDLVTGVTKIKIGATGVDVFLGTNDQSMGIRLNDATLGVVLFQSNGGSTTYALDASASAQLVGFDNVLTLSGTMGVRANNTGVVVNETVVVNGLAVPVVFTAGEENVRAVSGKNLTLSVAGFVTLTGDVACDRVVDSVTQTTTVRVAAENVSAFLGADDQSMGIRINDATLGVVLFGPNSYALEASAPVLLVGFEEVLTLTGTMGVRVNNTGGRVDEDFNIGGIDGSVHVDPTMEPQFSGDDVTLGIASFVNLTGDFSFTKSFDAATNTSKILAGVTGVNVFLGVGRDTPGTGDDLGIEITDATMLLAFYKDLTTNATSYALDASAGLQLVGFDALSITIPQDLTPTAGVRVNTTGREITETIVGIGTLHFSEDEKNVLSFYSTDIELQIADIGSVSGNFAFTKSVSGNVTKFLIGATEVSGNLTGSRVLENGKLGLVIFSDTNSSALFASGSAGLATVTVRRNSSTSAVNETVNVLGVAVPIVFSSTEVAGVGGPFLSITVSTGVLALDFGPIRVVGVVGVTINHPDGHTEVFVTDATLEFITSEPGITDPLLKITAAKVTWYSYPTNTTLDGDTYAEGLTRVTIDNGSLAIGGFVTISGFVDIRRSNEEGALTSVEFTEAAITLFVDGKAVVSLSTGPTPWQFNYSESGGLQPATQTPFPGDGSLLDEGQQPTPSGNEYDFGPLKITNPHVTLDDFSFGGFVNGKPKLIVTVSIGVESARIVAGPVTATITDNTVDEVPDDSFGIAGNFEIGVFLDPANYFLPALGETTLGNFKLKVDQLSVGFGSYLTITGSNLDLNPSAQGTKELLSVGDAIAGIDLNNDDAFEFSGEASNFAILGNGQFLAKDDFAVSFTVADGGEGGLGWPSWMPLTGLSVGLEWPGNNFNTEPLNFEIVLSATVETEIAGLGFTGGVEGVRISISKLVEGKFPIIGINKFLVGASGSLFGGTVEAELFAGVVSFDSAGNVLPDGSSEQADDSVFYAGFKGTLEIPALGGVMVRLGLCDQGPLSVYIMADFPIILDPQSGLALRGLRGGIDFAATLPYPEGATAKERAYKLRDGVYAPPTEQSLEVWMAQMKQQVVTLRDTSGGGFDVLKMPILLRAGATLYDAYASENVFRADVDVTLALTLNPLEVKILLVGSATFGNTLSARAYFFGDLSQIQTGNAKFLFLLDLPGGPARELAGMSVYGEFTSEFLTTLSSGSPLGPLTDRFLVLPEAGPVGVTLSQAFIPRSVTVEVGGSTLSCTENQAARTITLNSLPSNGQTVSVTYSRQVTDVFENVAAGTETITLTQDPTSVTVTVFVTVLGNRQEAEITFNPETKTVTLNDPLAQNAKVEVTYQGEEITEDFKCVAEHPTRLELGAGTPGSGGVSLAVNTFNPADGTVSVRVLRPTTDYTISGGTITLTLPDQPTDKRLKGNDTVVVTYIEDPQEGIEVTCKATFTLSGGVRFDALGGMFWAEINGSVKLTFQLTITANATGVSLGELTCTLDLTAYAEVSYLGVIGQAAGHFEFNYANDSVELHGALLVEGGDGLDKLNAAGIYVDGSLFLRINTSSQEFTDFTLEMPDGTRQSVPLAAQSFGLFFSAGAIFKEPIGQTVVFLLKGALALEIDTTGLRMLVACELKIQPFNFELLSFTANGLLMIQKDDSGGFYFAARLNLSFKDGGCLIPGVGLQAKFSLVVNTSRKGVEYVIPELSPPILTITDANGNNIEVINDKGQRTLVIPAGMPSLDNTSEGPAGFYVLVQGSGAVILLPGILDRGITGAFAFGLSVPENQLKVELTLAGALNLAPLGTLDVLDVSGALNIIVDTQQPLRSGLVGYLSASLSVGDSSAGLGFSGQFELQINTTMDGEVDLIQGLKVNEDGEIVTGEVPLDSPSLHLFIAGDLNIINLIIGGNQVRLENASLRPERLLGDLKPEHTGLETLVAFDHQLHKLAHRQIIGRSRLNGGGGAKWQAEKQPSTKKQQPE